MMKLLVSSTEPFYRLYCLSPGPVSVCDGFPPPCGWVSCEGLNHPAPLQRSVRHCSIRPWRAQQNGLLHVGSQTSHGEDIKQTDGLVQRQTDGNEVSVEPQWVTWGRTRQSEKLQI